MFGFAHNGHRALAYERDGHRVGADAVARDAAGGVAGVKQAPTTNRDLHWEAARESA